MSGAALEPVGVHRAAGEVSTGFGPGMMLVPLYSALGCWQVRWGVMPGAQAKVVPGHAGELNLGAGALGALKSNTGMAVL